MNDKRLMKFEFEMPTYLDKERRKAEFTVDHDAQGWLLAAQHLTNMIPHRAISITLVEVIPVD